MLTRLCALASLLWLVPRFARAPPFGRVVFGMCLVELDRYGFEQKAQVLPSLAPGHFAVFVSAQIQLNLP
jgi:hypothetical protein